MREVVQKCNVFDDAGTVAEQGDDVLVRGLIQIEFSIDIAERGARRGQLVQQPAFVLPWLDSVLFAGKPVDDRDLYACLPDSIA
jgi:hypothetical protein